MRLRPPLVPRTVLGVQCGTQYRYFPRGSEPVGFLTWKEAVVAAVLLALVILYLVLRDR
ncbi:MAG TPA: hypothetical protein VEU29_01045 [Actinomycetota bacterium]|nr:hypothetical protein [Actinomycetota bacterium]